MFRKRLVFSVLLSLSITIVCYAEPGKAVYSIPGNSTYLNPDPYSASGEVILDLSVASHIATGDIDSDPYDETVYAIAGSGVYVNLSNTPGDVFQIQTVDVTALAVGDVDGDGKDEILYTIAGGGVYLHDGVTTANIQLQPYDASIIVTGDVDGDGDDEIVYDLWINPGGAHAGIYLNQGTSGSDQQLQGASYVPQAIAVGEVDPYDPGEEVVYGLFYNGSGNGTYMNYGTPGSDWQFQPYTADAIAIGDIDGDGLGEIVYDLLDYSDNHNGLYINEGTSGSDHQFQPWNSDMIVIGDYEGDDDAEIIYNLNDYSGVPQGLFVNQGSYGTDIQIRATSADAIAFLPYVPEWDCVNPPQGDTNGDCIVDYEDLAALAGNWLYGTYPAETIFEETFDGTVIDTSEWVVTMTDGYIIQNEQLIFGKSSIGDGWDVWGKNYVYTTQSFPKISSGNVLQITMDVTLPANSIYVLGLFPGSTFNHYSQVDYGFHGNRNDRFFAFVQKNSSWDIVRKPAKDVAEDTYKLRLELGKVRGALWQYDIGDGWKTGKDNRGENGTPISSEYKFAVSSNFYEVGTLKIDNVKIEYVPPTPAQSTDPLNWPAPQDEEFNGAMAEEWVNWAGTPGLVWTPKSTADFTTFPGWLTLHGPPNGYGLLVRRTSFIPDPLYPFYAEIKFRYPTLDTPEANYSIKLSLLTDVDGDLYTDDVSYVTARIENLLATQQSRMIAGGTGKLPLYSGEHYIPYWNSGDMFIRIGYLNSKTINFAYKRNSGDPWTVFYTYDSTPTGHDVGIPTLCSMYGFCEDSDYPGEPPEPRCDAGDVSYEIDYVHFYTNP